jgi:hypothetical protein
MRRHQELSELERDWWMAATIDAAFVKARVAKDISAEISSMLRKRPASDYLIAQ